MSQQADIQPNSIEDILQILRNQALAMPPSSTSARYLRALESLESSVFNLRSSDCGQAANISQSSEDSKPRTDLKTEDLRLKTSLTDWLVNQWLMNTPFSTATLYLDIISSLYGSAVKADLLPPTKLFSQLKISLKAIGSKGWKSGIDDEIFERALRLTKNAARLLADDATAACMVMWSLTHSLQPLTEVALLTKSDVGLYTGVSQGKRLKNEDENNLSVIINQLSLNKSRYAFPLRQSQRTPKQLQAHVTNIINALFRRARLPQSTDPYQTVEALWAYAALRTGIPASTLISYLGHAPLGLPILRLSLAKPQRKMCTDGDEEQVARDLCSPASDLVSSDLVSSKENFATLREIGKIFLDNPPQWYAMSLRPGIRFTQVCRRIELLSTLDAQRTTQYGIRNTQNAERVTLFYPCEEIARAIGKKIVTRQRPFIYSVVFFRAKLTDIGRLFARIGDLAWCYRQSARPGAPYAHISDAQFRLFQQTIAQFTPDYEVAPTGELELKKNERVRIVGGLFAGHEATFDSVTHGRTVCNRPPQSGQVSASEDSRLKTEDSHTVYRLNIVGDNGIEWRINVDPRLTEHKN